MNPNHVRGETLYQGYIFRNLGSSSAKKMCMIGLSQRSYGGNLPQALISSVNSSVIGGWLANFQKICKTKIEKQ